MLVNPDPNAGVDLEVVQELCGNRPVVFMANIDAPQYVATDPNGECIVGTSDADTIIGGSGPVSDNTHHRHLYQCLTLLNLFLIVSSCSASPSQSNINFHALLHNNFFSYTMTQDIIFGGKGPDDISGGGGSDTIYGGKTIYRIPQCFES